MLTSNLAELDRVTSELTSRQDELAYAFVAGPTGEVLAHSFPGGFPEQLLPLAHTSGLRVSEFCTDEGRLSHAAVPLLDGAAGSAHLALSGRRESTQLAQTSLRLDLLHRARQLEQPPVVILITAYGTVPLAVEAMRRGAYDFLIKPFRVEDLEEVLLRGLEAVATVEPRCGASRPSPESIQPLALTLAQREREALHRALQATYGRRAEAARRLGISRNALWKKLKKLG